jgi:hypothetical protein
MMAGLGKAASKEEAKAIAVQYMAVLQVYPQWAILRACMRFSRGEVSAEEIGDKFWRRGQVPNTAQMAVVVRELMRPVAEESNRLRLCLGGTVPYKSASAEEREASRERVAAVVSALKEKTSLGNLDEKVAIAQRNERLDSARRKELKARIEEYRLHGLVPPQPVDGIITSLPMMLSMGYAIKVVGTDRVLVAPNKRAQARAFDEEEAE